MNKSKFNRDSVFMFTMPNCWLLLALLNVFILGCEGPSGSTEEELKVDRDIPPSEAFDASYGVWGPDGETVYFIHSEELGSEPDPGKLDQLWKLDLSTGNRRMIHTGRILIPDVSPSGQWIVFQTHTTPQHLYKMRSDGTDLQKLTGLGSPNPDWEYTIMGKWSPDESRILFSLSAGTPRGVSLMDSSGANTNIIIPYGVQASWSPDGSQIIYLNWDTTQTTTKQQQIYTANVDGTNPQKLTDLTHSRYMGDIAEPVVSPDGEKIAFTRLGRDGIGREIFIMNADGSGVEQITEGPGYAARPEWSPDGATILFSRIIPNVSKRMYYLDVATHEVTPVFPE